MSRDGKWADETVETKAANWAVSSAQMTVVTKAGRKADYWVASMADSRVDSTVVC